MVPLKVNRCILWIQCMTASQNYHKGAFKNYVDKILAFFDHLHTHLRLHFLPYKRWQKIWHFGTNYSPLLVNVVCERPLYLTFKVIFLCQESCWFLAKYLTFSNFSCIFLNPNNFFQHLLFDKEGVRICKTQKLKEKLFIRCVTLN